MKNFVKLTVVLLSIGLLAGCGSSGKKTKKLGYYGVFVDSAVAGVSYSCGGVTGVTDANGVFGICPAGSSATFSVGNVVLGTVTPTADNIFTPQDIVGVPRGTSDNEEVNLIASLLLSLDSDGDPTNGVSITPEIVSAFEVAVPTSTPMSAMTEATIATAVTATSDALPTVTLAVVPVEEASTHLIETAAAIEAGEVKAPVQPTIDMSTN